MQNNRATFVNRLRITPTIGLILALLLIAAAYWPGLAGAYLFDDYPNIVDNRDVQISTVNLPSLARVALSSPSSDFRRPLASLSFAANYYLTGANPFWMKLTNLFIHLLNGILVYVLALNLIRAAGRSTGQPSATDPRWIALLIAAGWLLLPINLTGVLYVVQRMESLANLFVLLGLLGYVRARQRMLESGSGFFSAVTSLLAASAAGLMSKETAAMTPLYAGLIEWTLFRGHTLNARIDKRVIGLFVIVLLLPLAVGLVWILPKFLSPDAWSSRTFDLPQRLLTETRVVVDYIRWSLLPTPQALSFYHDDYPISTGWLQPWTTLACSIFLIALVALILMLRKRAPLVSLGLALFLGAQLLTGTILPLELVYEHRNYFPSFGLLLAVVPLLAADSPRLPAIGVRRFLLGGLIILWTILTASTALAWGSPVVLARTLAERAPNSTRAQYGLGYVYIVLSKYDPKSPFAAAAYAPLERAMHLPGATILAEHALIVMNTCCMHQPVKEEWWTSLINKLKAQKPGAQDEGSLESLVSCAGRKECQLDPNKMLQAFMAALSHPKPSARLLATYGLYAWNVLGDRILGERMLAEAVQAGPKDPVYRISWIRMLALQGHKDDARQAIEQLETLNVAKRLDPDIAELRSLLNSDTQHAPATVGIDQTPRTKAN